MNVLVGERLSIITSKAQTTRHRIMGIVNGDDYQIVYSDTPGILKPEYKLQESMMTFVKTAIQDADLVVFVTDIKEPVKNALELMPPKVKEGGVPVILVINKLDLSFQTELEARVQYWREQLPKAHILPISAIKKFNTQNLVDKIIELLPESPPYFDKDQLTDKPERFFVSEIIREKILMNYDKEIPYSVEVVVNSFKDEEKIIRISTDIIVNRDSQKPILIGKGGSKLKKVGTEARKDLETFFQKKVFIELFVKVKKDWRDNDLQLKRFGYQAD